MALDMSLKPGKGAGASMDVASETSLEPGKGSAGGERDRQQEQADTPEQPELARPAVAAEAVALEVAAAPDGARAAALTEEEALFHDTYDAAPLRAASTKVSGAGGATAGAAPGAAPGAGASASLPWLTLGRKLLVRDVVTMLSCIALSFAPAYRRATNGFDSLTPIVALVTSLGPPLIYTVASETQGLINLVIFTPPQVAWAYVIFAAGTSNGVYIGLVFVYVFVASLCVFHRAPLFMLPMLLNVILLVLSGINMWKITLNGDSPSAQLGAVNRLVGGLLLALFVPFVLRVFFSLWVFPIRATHHLQRDLANLWRAEGAALAAVSSQYADIARITLRPETARAWLSFSRDDIDQLNRAREDTIAVSRRCTDLLFLSMVETRWAFRGETLPQVRLFDHSMHVIRLVRVALDGYVKKAEALLRVQETDPAHAAWLWSLQQEHDRRFAEFLKSYERRAEYERAVAVVGSAVGEISVLLTGMCGPLVELIELLLPHMHSLRPFLGAPALPRDKRARAGELVLRLEQAQARAERAVSELEPAAAEWIRALLSGLVALAHADPLRQRQPNGNDFFARSKLICFVLVLQRVVASQQQLVAFARELVPPEDGGAPVTRPTVAAMADGGLVASPPWLTEWRLTLFAPDMLLSAREGNTLRDFEPPSGCQQRSRVALDAFEQLLVSPALRVAVKMAVGTLLLSLPGYYAETAVWYDNYGSVQSLFSFTVVMGQARAGVAIERGVLRCAGMVVGYVYAGLAALLACVGGCTALGGWSLFLLVLPLLAAFLAVKDRPWAYGAYSSLKLYFSIVSGPQYGGSEWWTVYGGVLLSAVIGCLIGVLFAAFIVPDTGTSALRSLVADVFQNYMLLHERVLELRYRPAPSERDPPTPAPEPEPARQEAGKAARQPAALAVMVAVPAAPELMRAEMYLARRAFVHPLPILRTIQLERTAHVQLRRFGKVDPAEVVRAMQTVWRCLWTLHHLVGVRVQLLHRPDAASAGASAILPSSARRKLVIDRLLGPSIALLAASLASSALVVPTLRGVIASPKLLTEFLNDYVASCLLDDAFMAMVLGSQDLQVLAHLTLFSDTLKDISHALALVYDYDDSFRRPLKVTKRLREADQGAFHMHTRRTTDNEAKDE
jgi:hypothetical protein